MIISKKLEARILKSLEGAKNLDYFKRELIRILANQEKEDTKTVKKALGNYEGIFRVGYELVIEKGKAANIGETREWKGKKFRKIAPGKWRRIYESEGRGAKQSVKIIAKKIKNAQSTDELLELVMHNVSRFQDANGQLLPIVKELQDAVKEAKGRLNAGKPTAQQKIDEFNKKNSVLSEEERKNKQLKNVDVSNPEIKKDLKKTELKKRIGDLRSTLTTEEMNTFSKDTFINALKECDSFIQKNRKNSFTKESYENRRIVLQYGLKENYPEEYAKIEKSSDFINPLSYLQVSIHIPNDIEMKFSKDLEHIDYLKEQIDKSIESLEFLSKNLGSKTERNIKYENQIKSLSEVKQQLKESKKIAEKWNDRQIFSANKYKLSNETFDEVKKMLDTFTKNDYLKIVEDSNTSVLNLPLNIKDLSEKSKKELANASRNWRLSNSFGHSMSDIFIRKMMEDYSLKKLTDNDIKERIKFYEERHGNTDWARILDLEKELESRNNSNSTIKKSFSGIIKDKLEKSFGAL